MRNILGTILVCLIPILVFACWQFSFSFGLVDDAYITMVYARNVAEGHGIVFYPNGERVEGYTSPLWMGLLTLAALLDAPLPFVAFVLSLSCGLVTVLAVHFLYRRSFDREKNNWLRQHFWPCAAALTLVADVSFIAWSASGMEVTGYTLLTLLLAVSLIENRSLTENCILLFLLALIRPEGAALVLPCWIVWMIHKKKVKKVFIPFLVYFCLPFLLFLLFRLYYFGFLFPNTFYAKHDFGGFPLFIRGTAYVITFFQPRFLFLFTLFWLALDKENMKNGLVILLFALTHIILVILEGGDHFALHRFLVPVIPLLSILSIRGFERCCDQMIFDKIDAAHLSRIRLARMCIVVVVPILLLAHGNQLFEYKKDDRYGYSSGTRRLLSEVDFAENWSKMGKWLKAKYPPNTKIAVITAGAIPFYSELKCIDILGMNDVTIAHTPVEDRTRSHTGHEKSNPGYVLAQEPKFIQLCPLLFFSSKPFPKERLDELMSYPAQYDLWNHPEFREKYEYKAEKTEYGYISYFERK